MLRLKNLNLWRFFILIGIVAVSVVFFIAKERVFAENIFNVKKDNISKLPIFQETSFFPLTTSQPTNTSDVIKKVKMVVTAYSSSPQETQGDPFITASGERVRDGIVANNLLPFGSKIRIPRLFGDKVFVVKDRMNAKKGYYHVDIWFPSRKSALEFGSKITEIEILK